MPKINWLRREIIFKIIFFGPAGMDVYQTLANAYQQLSLSPSSSEYLDFTPVDAERLQLSTPYGFSFKFSLYALPHRLYYKSAEKIVFQNVDGILFLGNRSRDRLETHLEALSELEDLLRINYLDIYEVPLVNSWIASDPQNSFSSIELEHYLNILGSPAWESSIKEDSSLSALQRCAEMVLQRFKVPSEETMPFLEEDSRESQALIREVPRPPSPHLHRASAFSIPSWPKYAPTLQNEESKGSYGPVPENYSFPFSEKTGQEIQEIQEFIRKGLTAREMWYLARQSPYYLEALDQIQKTQSASPHFYSHEQARREFLLPLVFGRCFPKTVDVLSVLISALKDADELLCRKTIWALGHLGKEAQIAIPELNTLAKYSSQVGNELFQKNISKALRKISLSSSF